MCFSRLPGCLRRIASAISPSVAAATTLCCAAVERLLAAHEAPASILDRSLAGDSERPFAATDPAVTVTVGENDVHDDEQQTETTAGATLATLPSERPRSFVAEQIIAGRYTLRQILGEGGMGTVYRADQTEPVKRQVALKVIKIGMDSRTVLARFNAERQALALMDHPNIARVFDGGTTDAGQPFFVMELVHGVPITSYCDSKKFPVNVRLELFVAVCQAVQHAHQKGIIHRDLKPSNVLVTEVDGRPTPKVIDFGVAKATEFDLTDQSLGDTGAIVGTPAYMSPEQAEPTSMDIDTRTDIYALGVILYELLAGSPPIDPSQFKRGALLEMLRMVREVDPPKPSTKVSAAEALPNIAASRGIEPAQLKRALSGDLDWIVMKALEKDRTRRYETANGFAGDILRHLSSEPVLAAPPSWVYRLRKFVRKHRGAVIAACLVLLTLLAGIAGTSWGMFWANRERLHALKAEDTTRAQKGRAEERERLAIAAVKRYGDVVSETPELKNDASLFKLRATLLKEPQAFFKQLRSRLQEDRETTSDALERLALANFDLGYITSEIGSKREALRDFEESLAIFERLARLNPSDTELQRNLAGNHQSIGIVQSALGRPNEALASIERGRGLLERLSNDNPSVAAFRSDLAKCENSVGLLEREMGRPDEALVSLTKARAIWEQLSRENPTVADYQNGLALSYQNIGVILQDSSRLMEALASYQQALAICERMSRENPSDTVLLRDLAEAHHNVGRLLFRANGAAADGLKAFEQALKIRKRLATENPSVTEFQRYLAQSYDSIGVLHQETGHAAGSTRVVHTGAGDSRATGTRAPRLAGLRE